MNNILVYIFLKNFRDTKFEQITIQKTKEVILAGHSITSLSESNTHMKATTVSILFHYLLKNVLTYMNKKLRIFVILVLVILLVSIARKQTNKVYDRQLNYMLQHMPRN